MEDQEKEFIDTVKGLLKDINTKDREALCKDGFEDIQKHIDRILIFTKTLEANADGFFKEDFFKRTLTLSPQPHRNSLKKDLLQTKAHFERIIKGDFESHHLEIIKQDIKNYHNEFYNNFDFNLTFFTLKEAINPQINQELLDTVNRAKEDGEKIAEIKKEADEDGEKTAEIKKEADEMLEGMRIVSGEVGAATYARIFKTQAESKLAEAQKWFKFSKYAIIALILFSLLSPIFSLLSSILDFDKWQIFALYVSVFGLGVTALTQFIKNYNANMHLGTVNEHRANCLATFGTFYKSTENAETKNTILLQAAKTSFETGDTGYLASKNKSPAGLNSIVKFFNQGKGE